jgi:hypothetical protein
MAEWTQRPPAATSGPENARLAWRAGAPCFQGLSRYRYRDSNCISDGSTEPYFALASQSDTAGERSRPLQTGASLHPVCTH